MEEYYLGTTTHDHYFSVERIIDSVIDELLIDPSRRYLLYFQMSITPPASKIQSYRFSVNHSIISLHQVHLRRNGFLHKVVGESERREEGCREGFGGQRPAGVYQRRMVHERRSWDPLC